MKATGVTGLGRGGVAENHAKDQRADDRADRIEALCEVQAEGFALLVAELDDIGIAVRLERGGAERDNEHGEQE